MFTKRFMLLFFIAVISINHCNSESLETTGHWKDVVVKSLISSKPYVSINGDEVEIYFPKAIENVLISLYDEQGGIVFEQYVSVDAMETFSFKLENEGEYCIEIFHPERGFLSGRFRVEMD